MMFVPIKVFDALPQDSLTTMERMGDIIRLNCRSKPTNGGFRRHFAAKMSFNISTHTSTHISTVSLPPNCHSPEAAVATQWPNTKRKRTPA